MFDRIQKLRPTASGVIALVALVVAMGGVSYAAATIGSAEIKNNSVRGKDVKNRSLSGKDVKANGIGGGAVKESTLGTVPKAAQAVQAADAASVDGRSAECPAGTQLFLGQCFETVARPAVTTVFNAAQVCAAAGRYLPDTLQLRQFRDVPGIDLAAPSEYTAAVSNDRQQDGADRAEVMIASEAGAVLDVATTDDRPYRCVAPLVG